MSPAYLWVVFTYERQHAFVFCTLTHVESTLFALFCKTPVRMKTLLKVYRNYVQGKKYTFVTHINTGSVNVGTYVSAGTTIRSVGSRCTLWTSYRSVLGKLDVNTILNGKRKPMELPCPSVRLSSGGDRPMPSGVGSDDIDRGVAVLVPMQVTFLCCACVCSARPYLAHIAK